MEQLTSHTINEEAYKVTLFEDILIKVKEGKSWVFMYDSFEQYYYILKRGIEYFENKGEFDSCAIFLDELSNWLKKIPYNTNDAIKYLMKITPVSHQILLKDRDTFSLAINLHKSTGATIIDIWLLRFEESPLRRYYEKEHKITNADQIANDVLIKFIDAIKAILD